MGVGTTDHERKIYYGIVGGKVTRRFKEHQTNQKNETVTVERKIYEKDKVTVKKTVIEQYYDYIEGRIIKTEVDKSGDYGANLMIHMNDGNDTFIFQVKLNSSYGRAIMNRIQNVDPNKDVKFQPYSFDNPDKPDKKLVGVTVYQEDCGWEKDKVPYKWTQENPGDMPDWEKKEVAGEEVWDNSAQLNFMYKHFLSWGETIEAIEVPITETSVANEKPLDSDAEKMAAQFEAEQGKTTPESMKPEIPSMEDMEEDDLPF